MMKRFNLLTLLICTVLLVGNIHAQSRDGGAGRNEPTHVEADRLVYDDTKQVGTFTGNVVLTRGTLVLKGPKMVVSQDAEGFQYATLQAAPGAQAFFRQKRSGGNDLWVEGLAADKIVFNGKTEVVQFFGNAQVTLLEGSSQTDQVQGEYISYDSRADVYTVNNSPTGQSKKDGGRIRITIQPRNNSKGE